MKKTVLITGGTRGIGAATVRIFSEKDWNIAFTYQKSDEIARKISAEYDAYAIKADLSNPQQIKASVKKTEEVFGGIDALICNAAIAEQKMFQDLSDEDFENMLEINLFGAVRYIRAVLPQMIHLKKGSIITVSSIWGMEGASCESHYSASKAAIIGLSKSLAKELGPSGIRVNCVAPGVIATDMNAQHSTEVMNELADETALKRIGTAKEVAQSIYFLASDAASFINGQIIGVTGGF